MNIQKLGVKKRVNRHNNPLLPQSLRSLVVGRSNCGKTNFLLNLLLRDGFLDYDNLLVFGHSLHQDDYQVIKKGYQKGLSKDQLSNLFQNAEDPLSVIDHYKGELKGGIKAEFYENCDDIPDPKTLNPKLKNLIIFDDCYLGKQSTAGSYYSRGRHNSCDCIFLSQNYFTLPRNSIRENANFIILFPQNNKSVIHLHQDHCSELLFEEFRELCTHIWGQKYHFLTIDLTCEGIGKYRDNLELFYIPRKNRVGGMSFINITNPNKRDEIVKDYIKTKNVIRDRYENEKENNLLKQELAEESARPIIEATKESAETIKSAIENPKDNLTLYNDYSNIKQNRDRYFAISRDKKGFKLGAIPITMDANGVITVYGKSYEYTPGFWNLIFLNNPENYTDEDKKNYDDLVISTSLINHPRLLTKSEYYKRLTKYTFLSDIRLQKRKSEEEEETEREEKRNKEEEPGSSTGSGIILPSDINSLKQRLQLICAEREAGNIKATTPELVAILDELLRRGFLTKTEYNIVCKELKC